CWELEGGASLVPRPPLTFVARPTVTAIICASSTRGNVRHARSPRVPVSPQRACPAVKALLCTRLGTAEDLTLADLPDPAMGPGEVVVKVAAVGLNFFDTLIIAGKY